MPDNQEIKEKELLDCPFCGDNDLVKAHGNSLRTWVECIRCNCIIHNVGFTPAKDIWNARFSSKQLTTTQQALDSSCQTNQILVKRLKVAEEALEKAKNLTEMTLISADFTFIEAALNIIQGK